MALKFRLNTGVKRVPVVQQVTPRAYATDLGYPAFSEADVNFAAEPSINSDTIRYSFNRLPETDMLGVMHYEIEINGVRKNVPWGPQLAKVRRAFGLQSPFTNRIRVRAVFRPKSVIFVGTGFGTINVGDTVTDVITGATALVLAKQKDSDDGNLLVVSGATGQFGCDHALAVGGVAVARTKSRADYKNWLVIENSSVEYRTGDRIVGENGTFGYVGRVEHISGKAAGGNWKARIYYAGSNGTMTGGMLLTIDSADAGNVANEGLRHYPEDEHTLSGYVTDQAGPWLTLDPITCVSGAPVVTLTAVRGDRYGAAVAPAGFMIRADVTGMSVEDERRDLDYKWTYPYGGRLLQVGTATREDFGLEMSDGYTAGLGTYFALTPGDHTITCQVIDKVTRQVTATGSITITAEDPDTVFAGKTYTVGSGKDYPTLAAAQAAEDIAGEDRRFIIDNGLDETDSVTFENLARVSLEPATLGGTPPVFRNPISFNPPRDTPMEVSIREINTDGGFSASFLGEQEAGPNGINLANETVATIFGCYLRRGNTILSPASYNGATFVGDTRIEEWHNYGIQAGDAGRFCAYGLDVVQVGDAYFAKNGPSHKGDGGPPRIADHGPIRLSRQATLNEVVWDRGLRASNSDWSDGGRTTQAPVRYDQGGHGLVISESRVWTEGGTASFGSGGNPGNRTNLSEQVTSMSRFLFKKGGDNLVQISSTAMLSNCLIVVPDAPVETARGPANGVAIIGTPTLGSGAGWYDLKANRARVEHNTVVDLRRSRYMTGQNGNSRPWETLFKDSGEGPALPSDIWSNALHRPNDGGPDVGPLDMSAGAAPVYKGRRVVDEQPLTYSGADGFLPIDTGCHIVETGDTGTIMTMERPEKGAGNMSIVWDGVATPEAGHTVRVHILPVRSDRGAVGATIIGQASGASAVVLSTFNGSLALGPVSGGPFVAGETVSGDGYSSAITGDPRVTSVTIDSIAGPPGALQPVFAPSAAAMASFRPLAGSSLIAGATDRAPVRDYFGKLRPGTVGGPAGIPSLGAVEP